MQSLNLPRANCQVIQKAGKSHIFDMIRKKHIMWTPEEWVRQHFLHFLIYHLHYPKALIRVESQLRYNQRKKRSDILIYDREGRPHMLVECKSYDVKIQQAGFNQAAVYNKQLGAKYMVLTNGMKHYCCTFEDNEITFLDEIPECTSVF